MNKVFDFFKIDMPGTRIADFHLACLDGCVFIDFNIDKENCVYLKRISFDGYGCCDLNEDVIPMNKEETRIFTELYRKEDLDQKKISSLILKTIENNKKQIWQKALKEYGLIE